MKDSLKLVSVNIEYNKHFDKVEVFAKSIKPDVLCIQEVIESDVPRIKEITNMSEHIFAPMTKYTKEAPDAIFGIGIFSRVPIINSSAQYYSGNCKDLKVFDQKDLPGTMCRVFLSCEVKIHNQIMKIGTTHFTWTPDALSDRVDPIQEKDMQKLLAILKDSGELVFTGDFNAPRGKPVFTMLADNFKDNVPLKYTTSIDGNIHHKGPMELMIDGIFSTSGYTVSGVEMICGVSDHCALVAEVSKTR